MISNERLRWLIDDYNGNGATTKCEADLSRELLYLRKEKQLLIENSERLYKTLSRYVGPDCLGVIKHKDLMKQVK